MVRPTALLSLLTVTLTLTLTYDLFNPRRGIIMTHTRAKIRGQRSGGSRVEWKQRTDMTDFITFLANAVANMLSPCGRRENMLPPDGSSTRGGSKSVRRQVRSPHMAKLEAASVQLGQLRA